MKSNRLTVLAGKVREHLAASAAAEKTAIEQAIEAGYALIEAKAACKHGEWLPFLQETDVSERKAQRYMRLARLGLKSDTVSDLGGIKAALDWAEGLLLPSDDEYLIAHVSEDIRAFVWSGDGGHFITVIDLGCGDSIVWAARPITIDDLVFPILFAMLSHRYAEMTFRTETRFGDDFHRFLTGEACIKCGSKMEAREEISLSIYVPRHIAKDVNDEPRRLKV